MIVNSYLNSVSPLVNSVSPLVNSVSPLVNSVSPLVNSEKDSLSDEQRQELLSTINLELVSEQTLQRALDSDLVSPEPIARAALKLCSSLRSELDSVKYIAQMQEEELHKYQSMTSAQPSPRAAPFPAAKMDSDSGQWPSRHGLFWTVGTSVHLTEYQSNKIK